MSEKNQQNRWRCTVVGCNPILIGQAAADGHSASGHRVAKWPVRSPEGRRRALIRNRTGYYDRYNVGGKSAAARGLRPRSDGDEVVLTGDDFSLESAGPFGGAL